MCGGEGVHGRGFVHDSIYRYRCRLGVAVQFLSLYNFPYLYNALHEVLLCNGIPAADNLFKHIWQDFLLVEGRVHCLQLGEAH